MNDNQLDERIFAAIRKGNCSREKLMEIDVLRMSTWAVVGGRLKVLTKCGVLIASKAGWRLAK
ncbi:MAG: hypothetical protein K2Y13_03115 [Burkholderiaceae bacterium]|nr:hypothetical protein [Burkholderiaceae bacterium]